uniref:COMM domain containing 10 n=1 Tax=Anas zonorhyncha TaxID=75864 RepID=A0A8B9V0B2_9AVES
RRGRSGGRPLSIPPPPPRAVLWPWARAWGGVRSKRSRKQALLSAFPARFCCVFCWFRSLLSAAWQKERQESVSPHGQKAESSFSEEEEEKLQIAFSLEKQDLHLVLETISFILEQAVYHNLKPASLQQQLQSIHLDQDKAEAFASAWAAAGQDTIEKFRQRVLTPQKLETIGWQLNLQMAESMQAKLKSPRAVLELGVSNEDSKENCVAAAAAAKGDSLLECTDLAKRRP